MKKKEIVTGKATIVVVDLPEGARFENTISNCMKIHFGHSIETIRGQYKWVGSPKEITEEQWKGIVDPSSKYSNFYKSYDLNDNASFAYLKHN